MFRCACGAEFFDEAYRKDVVCNVNGINYTESFPICPRCGGYDYWDVQVGGSEEEEPDEED